MTFFSDAQTNEKIEKTQTDVVGGGSYVLETGIHQCLIKKAYAVVSAKGAKGVSLRLETTDGKELRETVYVTRSKENGGGNTYKDKRTKETKYLPGFELVDSLIEIVLGEHLSGVETDTQIVNVWDAKSRKEVPQEVPVITELTDKPIYVCVFKCQVNKQLKTDNGYVATAELIDTNEIAKFLRASDRKSVVEIRADQPAEFFETWKAQWEGKTRDKTVKGDVAPAPGPAASDPTASAAAPSGIFK